MSEAEVMMSMSYLLISLSQLPCHPQLFGCTLTFLLGQEYDLAMEDDKIYLYFAI